MGSRLKQVVKESWASTPLEHWGSQVERRRRENRGAVGGEGMESGGAVPLPKKFRNFSSHNGVIWCILGVLFFEIHVLKEKSKTLVKILGVDNTGRPLQVKYWGSRPLQPLQR